MSCRRALPLLLALAEAACKGDGPPGCRIAARTDLAATALTSMTDVALLPSGPGFVLVGRSGDDVRWAPLAADGTLGTESGVTLPAGRALQGQAWFAVAGASAPGEQLIAVVLVPKPGAEAQLEAQAVVQAAGGAAAAPRALFDLPADADRASLRLAMGTSRSGLRAALAWGFEGRASPAPQVLLLGPGAEPVGAAAALYRDEPVPPGWRCLAFGPSRSDLAVTVVEPGPSAPTGWRLFELQEGGGRGFELTTTLDATPTGCPAATPTARGYVIAYQDADGTYLSDFDVDHETVSAQEVSGSLQYGGPVGQPPVGCVAPMGREFGLLFARSSGPEVWRFDAFGSPQGSALPLPSRSRHVGPIASWPATDALFVTYLDPVNQARRSGDAAATDGASSGNQRYFIRVTCPTAATGGASDAGADAADARGGN